MRLSLVAAAPSVILAACAGPAPLSDSSPVPALSVASARDSCRTALTDLKEIAVCECFHNRFTARLTWGEFKRIDTTLQGYTDGTKARPPEVEAIWQRALPIGAQCKAENGL